jgi:glycerol 3-phosphatase-2
MPLSPLLARYDNVVLDLDGCVWVGSRPTRGAADAIAALRAEGKSLAFATNDSRHSPEEYVRKLWGLGVQASLAEIVTAGSALQFVLAERFSGVSAYVIGSQAIFRHVKDAGLRIVNGSPRAPEAEIVVVAGHDGLDYQELRGATQALLSGASLIATNRDRSYPTDQGIAPGTGAIVAALEYATGAAAEVVGKPRPALFETALDRFGGGRTLVVGDRLDSDLTGAAEAGLEAAIVLSGVTSASEAAAASDPAPVAVADDLHRLALGT